MHLFIRTLAAAAVASDNVAVETANVGDTGVGIDRNIDTVGTIDVGVFLGAKNVGKRFEASTPRDGEVFPKLSPAGQM